MSFTRRLPERSRSVAFVLAAAAVAGSAALSCADDAPPLEGLDVPDAAPEAEAPEGDAEPEAEDAGSTDASKILDGARSDAAPLPVVCASSPCATALTTTLDSEGFCALSNDKTVACWGQNGNAQLGRGADAGLADSPTPARVPDLTDIVALEHTCAIDSNGAVWCWGKGPYLRSGDVATTTERTPVKLELPPVATLGVAAETACAIIEGGVSCWGANVNGQVAVSKPSESPSALPARVIATPPGAPMRDLVVGNASFLLRADGSVVSWGANPPLGRVSSMMPDPYPMPLSLANVSGVAAAGDSACAVVEGVAYCWGSTLYTGPDAPAQPFPERKLPEPVLTPEPIVQIATTPKVPYRSESVVALPQRACAVGVSGAVYCWGSNGSGQAGDGTTSYAYAPVKVAGLPGPVARVATTPKTTCALLTSGAIHCWGDNLNGQLGRGKGGPPSFVPQEVLLP